MDAVQSRCILIVDDSVELAENIAEILEIDGHITAVAASAEEGLASAKERRPHVVVTDYHLPGINGADFVKRLRDSLPGGVRAVIISAHSDERTMRDAADAGATSVAKPVDLRMLTYLVAEAAADGGQS